MFEGCISCACTKVDPFKDVHLAPQLELSLDELIALDKERKKVEVPGSFIVRPPHTKTKLPFKPKGYISPCAHKRTMFEKVAKGVLAVKGVGVEEWDGVPIYCNDDFVFDTQKVWGGDQANVAREQYLNALILQALAKRHNFLYEPTYWPVQILHPIELPYSEDGVVEMIPVKEYGTFSGLEVVELDALAQLWYVGIDPHLRVMNGFNAFEKNPVLSTGNRKADKKKVFDFAMRLGKILQLVHIYDGTGVDLSKNGDLTTCFMGNNISTSGVVYDLDTISFGLDARRGIDEETLAHYQCWERDRMTSLVYGMAKLYGFPSHSFTEAFWFGSDSLF